MPRTSKIRPHLLRRMKRLSGPARKVIEICEHYDGRFPPIAIGVLISIASRICAGQRVIRKEEIASDARISPVNLGRWIDRLVDGGYVEREFAPGIMPARYALRAPSEAQMAWRWPDGRKDERPAQIVEPEPFDADRHRALGAKFGFETRATDLLVELRESLSLPRKRA